MLTSVADWTTESITFDFRRGVQVLSVSGDYRGCDPDALRLSLAEYVGISEEDVFTTRNLLVIVAPMGVFVEPASYRAWVDAGVSDAERHTMAMAEVMGRLAQVAAENIALLAADAGLSTDAVMRAALVAPETADAIMAGELLPVADLVRIATALGVSVESLRSPGTRWT